MEKEEAVLLGHHHCLMFPWAALWRLIPVLVAERHVGVVDGCDVSADVTSCHDLILRWTAVDCSSDSDCASYCKVCEVRDKVH